MRKKLQDSFKQAIRKNQYEKSLLGALRDTSFSKLVVRRKKYAFT
jgi:hypothetical protein